MELRLDQIDAGHLLGDGVLDLDTRVALDEIVLAGVRRHQELDGAGVEVVRRLHQLDGIGENPLPKRVVEAGRRRRLDDFLIAQLNRAVALVQVQDVALAVGQDLHLDVAWTLDQFLYEQGTIAEGARGLTAAAFERLGHGLRVPDLAHAPATTTARGLEHDGVAQLLRGGCSAISRFQSFAATGHDGNPERRRQRAGADLVTEQGQRLRRRADERQTRSGAAVSESGVLGQKTVSRMDAVATALLRDGNQCLGIEIRPDGIVRRPVADFEGDGRDTRVQRQSVHRGEHTDRFDAEVGCRLGDTDRDLAAIADEDSLEHARDCSTEVTGHHTCWKRPVSRSPC